MSNLESFWLGKSNRMNLDFRYKDPFTLEITINSGDTHESFTVSPHLNGWISVDNRLPVPGDLVLCLDICGNRYTAWHSDIDRAWYGRNDGLDEDVCLDIDYWMPIPELPKED